MAEYSEKEFSKIKWRVDKVDINSYNPLISFPDISFYPEFTTIDVKDILGDNFGRVVAYIIFAYDMNSPYVRHNDNIVKRKREAMLASGFKLNKSSRFPILAENIILNKLEIANNMIIRFLRILKSSEWASYITYQDVLFELLGKLKSGGGLEVSDYKNTIANTKELREEIKSLEESFLESDTNQNLVEALYDTIETDDLDMSAEDIARRIYMKQEPKLFNPYEEDKPIEDFILQNLKRGEET